MNKKIIFGILITIVLLVIWYVVSLDWRGNDAKTFYNTKHSFSFEYPPHWYVTGDEMADIIQLSTVEQESGDGGLPLGMRVEIIVSENPDKINLEDWVDSMSGEEAEEIIDREAITTIAKMSNLSRQWRPLDFLGSFDVSAVSILIVFLPNQFSIFVNKRLLCS